MDIPSKRTEHVFIKLLLGGLFGFVFLIAIIIGGYRFYKHWEGDRLVKRAETYLTWGDARSAILTARRAYQVNPSNADACRFLARIAERAGDVTAMDWRRQVLAILPHSIPDQVALARTALAFNQLDTATATLASIGPEAEQLASYHEAQGQLAIARQDIATAERQYEEAVRLDAPNKVYQLKLAVLQLQSPAAETRNRASTTLRQFQQDKSLRVPAARALRDDAAQRKDASALIEVTEQLFAYPEANFRDRISCLQVLQALRPPEFASKLTEVQSEAAKDAAKLVTLLSWMNNNNLAVLALDWIKRSPPELSTNKMARVAVADCYVTANDPDGLAQWCKQPGWGDVEFLRHAYLAWSARVHADELGFETEWTTAMRSATTAEQLFSLEQNAAKWKWKQETENLLWQLTKDPERQIAALTALTQYYNETGDTAQLYRAVSRLDQIRPNDQTVQNNLANISLLLNLNVENANRLAEQLYHKSPTNPVFASTYAFSLYRKGKYQQAVGIMDQLKPAELEQPAMAAYYGVFLAAEGDKSKAEQYLERGSKARLLPEEKALVEQARSSVGGS